MPGIAGIIGRIRREEALERVQEMLQAMSIEPFYSKGFYVNEDLGLYAGWLVHPNSFSDCMPIRSEDGSIALLLNGEVFTSDDRLNALRRDGYRAAESDARHLAPMYQQLGDRFFEELNGTFAGILVNSHTRTLQLFNDRLGFDKLYYSQDGETFNFSSEAKSLLRVLPCTREFDPQGLAQFLGYGCTFEQNTLYKDISLLPPASLWEFSPGRTVRKKTYFRPEDWQTDSSMGAESFHQNFNSTFRRVLPRYFSGRLKSGVSLTGGWDTRMVMACHETEPRTLPCYTFAGLSGETRDVQQARKVARIVDQEHIVLRLQSDFLTDFPQHAEKTIYSSDGNGSVSLSHEIYLNRLARSVAGNRVTGNFGSEILRGMTTFKEILPASDWFQGELKSEIAWSRELWKGRRQTNAARFAIFTEIPWKHAATVRLANSQLPIRTPFFDNEILRLACICPPSVRRESLPVSLIKAANPSLVRIPTDRGVSGEASLLVGSVRQSWYSATFKLDYLLTEGMPILGAVTDKARLHHVLPLRHKYLDYQRWFRGPLKGYIDEMLGHGNTFVGGLLGRKAVDQVLQGHGSLMDDKLSQINTLMTLELINSCLLRVHRRERQSVLEHR
jgi:asparagine synthase (glutamine-hydrolysing)